MELFPLWNSLRVALISTVCTFFLGMWAAYAVSRMSSRAAKGALDCLFTLPLVLPPTVVGFFLLKTIGPNAPVGALLLRWFDLKVTMTWYSAVFATVIVTLPLMYRTARGAFEAFDPRLASSAQTLGLSNSFIFWRVRVPNVKAGLTAGAVLAFARALGEYGATSMVTGYIPGRTATISTTVYQLWREGNDAEAYRWVFINLGISLLMLLALNLLERRPPGGRRGKAAL